MILDIVIFIFVLGLMVFFHELGHFLAAKACGIYVERFSLGMPPRAFGLRIGETDYCVGALPLGGYVKMAGQEDTPMTDEERKQTYGGVPEARWFNNKPVWQRFIVIAAGPLMNMVLAVLLYGIVAAVGANVRETDADNRIGPIAPDSPAESAPLYRLAADGAHPDLSRTPDAVGWQTGDRILNINGSRVRNIYDVGIDAVLAGNNVVDVEVERPNADGTTTRYLSPVAPKRLAEGGRARFGVAPFETALISSTMEDSPARASGIEKGDIILRANGKTIDNATLTEMVEKLAPADTLELDIQRGGEVLHKTLHPYILGRFLGMGLWSTWALGTERDDNAQPVVTAVEPKFTETTGIKPKDIIETVEGQPATLGLINQIEQTRPGTTVHVEVLRPAVLFGLLRKADHLALELPISSVGAIGVRWDVMRVFHRVPVSEAPLEALRLSYQSLARTVRTLQMLVTGGVSPKELGGPVLIYQVTTAAAHEGYAWLLNTTAFISVNLAVFNLLPLPILDGSLLVYLVIEGVRRKPLNVRVLERVQQVGLVLIISLLLYVTFNDIKRIVESALQ